MSLKTFPGTVLTVTGSINAIVGFCGLIRSQDWRAFAGDQFGGSIPSPLGYTLSLQLLNIGIFTILAAGHPKLHYPALVTRTCLHALAAFIFWVEGANMQMAATLDTVFAIVSGIAMLYVPDEPTPRDVQKKKV